MKGERQREGEPSESSMVAFWALDLLHEKKTMKKQSKHMEEDGGLSLKIIFFFIFTNRIVDGCFS